MWTCVCVSLVLGRKILRCHEVLWQSHWCSFGGGASRQGWRSYLKNSVCGLGEVGGWCFSLSWGCDVTQVFSAQGGDLCIWGTKNVWGCRVESWRPEQGTVQDSTGDIKVFIILELSLAVTWEQGREVEWGPWAEVGRWYVRRLMPYVVQGQDDVFRFRVK